MRERSEQELRRAGDRWTSGRRQPMRKLPGWSGRGEKPAHFLKEYIKYHSHHPLQSPEDLSEKESGHPLLKPTSLKVKLRPPVSSAYFLSSALRFSFSCETGSHTSSVALASKKWESRQVVAVVPSAAWRPGWPAPSGSSPSPAGPAGWSVPPASSGWAGAPRGNTRGVRRQAETAGRVSRPNLKKNKKSFDKVIKKINCVFSAKCLQNIFVYKYSPSTIEANFTIKMIN